MDISPYPDGVDKEAIDSSTMKGIAQDLRKKFDTPLVAVTHGKKGAVFCTADHIISVEGLSGIKQVWFFSFPRVRSGCTLWCGVTPYV